MHRSWTKIVVTSLVMLGDGAFASEGNPYGDGSDAFIDKAVQHSLPVVTGNDESGWKPVAAISNLIPPGINLAYQSFSEITAPVSDLLKHHPCSPRAPPIPAN